VPESPHPQAPSLQPLWQDIPDFKVSQYIRTEKELLNLATVLEAAGKNSTAGVITRSHLYRIAQEAVINAVKHGKSQTVTICLEAIDDGINLKIADDGVGVSSPVVTTEGLGVRIMQYRANVIGAAFSISPGDTEGTVVTCSLSGHVQNQLLAST